MKISDIDVLITKVEAKKNKEGVDYIAINLLDILSGDNFDIISKNLEHIRLKPMTKYSVNLILSCSKYGLKLEFEKIGKELGGI